MRAYNTELLDAQVKRRPHVRVHRQRSSESGHKNDGHNKRRTLAAGKREKLRKRRLARMMNNEGGQGKSSHITHSKPLPA